MRTDLEQPVGSNPDCPAETVKAVLGGEDGDARAIGATRRVVLIATGLLSLATGVIGIFVPVLPTTCFLLLAVWCFGKTSPRLHAWMLSNRWFGEYLRDYRDGRGIPRTVKVGSLSILWLTIGSSVVFAVGALWVRLLLVAIALAVTVHVAGLRNSALRADSAA